MSTIRTVTDADFATVVLEAGGPVLVGFWPPRGAGLACRSRRSSSKSRTSTPTGSPWSR